MATIATVLALALLATACSSGDTWRRSASGSLGDPTSLPALAQVATGSGLRAPLYSGSVVTPDRGVATSLSPTILIPGAVGAWSFRVTDLSDGVHGGFVRTYDTSGTSVRIPLGAGLEQGRTYSWRATTKDDPSRIEGGTFTVDVQSVASQQFDPFAGVGVGLSSGELMYSWKSHTVSALGGEIGFGLQFAPSSPDDPGVPSGWNLSATTSSQFTRIQTNEDLSVGLVSSDSTQTTYIRAGEEWRPVHLSGSRELTGAAPVLTSAADGTWTLTTKQSTSTFSAPDDKGVSYLTGVSVSGKPAPQQIWKGGLLRAVVDPVTERKVEFLYGGSSCPAPAAGFVAAPDGMLCLVKFWDGSTTTISYVRLPDGSVSIGRMVDRPEAKGEGAAVTDLAYDAVGRIARLRTPLVASAIASGIIGDDEEFRSAVVYDDDGRVVSVVRSAPSTGGQRRSHSYRYGGSKSEIVDDQFGGVVNAVRFDPATMAVLDSTDAAGLTTAYDWDPSTGALLRTVGPDGSVSTSTYKDGQIAESRGPTTGSLATDAAVVSYGYDQTFAESPDGTPMKGLDTTYWSNPEWSGLHSRDELGPQLDGAIVPSLTVNWSASPTGTQAWSARMTGVFVVDTKGEYTFVTAGRARVWVDSVLCSATVTSEAPPIDAISRAIGPSAALAARPSGCNALPLDVGLHSIRIDVSSIDGASSMGVRWSGPDTGGSSVSMPTSITRPRYGYQTLARSLDATSTFQPSTAVKRTLYANPASGESSGSSNQAGFVTSADYQASSGRSGEWGQQIATSRPGGGSYSFDYWGDKESAKAPCPSAVSAPQGGLAKSTTLAGAGGANPITTLKWFDASGAVVATQYIGGAVECVKYDRAHRKIVSETMGMGETVRSTVDYGVGGNPLITETTSVVGSTRTTTRSEIDLLGREVSSTDANGVTQVRTFDPRTGNEARLVTTVPGSAPIVLTTTYDGAGRIASVAVDGTVIETLTYDSAGRTATVTYGNGVILRPSYGTDGQVDAHDITMKDGARVVTTESRDRGGRVLGATWTVAGRTSSATYFYDDARRLSEAILSPGLTDAHVWDYTYDKDSNRTSKTVDGRLYSSRFDSSGRLISTEDPSVKGSIEYDDRGNTVVLGADRFAYDATNHVTSMTDGSTTVSYERDASGAVLARTIADAAGSTTVRPSSGGVVLDDTGRILSQRIALAAGATLVRKGSTTTYEFTDLAGNRFVAADAAGIRVGEVSLYDPFGSSLTPSGPIDPAGANLGWQAASANESFPLATPAIVMGERVYVPSLGRFLQIDPVVGGSANPYDFVNQDPINSADPSGQFEFYSFIASMALSFIAAALTGGLSELGVVATLAVGALEGAIIGAASNAIEQAVTTSADPSASFDVSSLLIDMGIGAIMGFIGGGLGGSLRSSPRVAWVEPPPYTYPRALPAHPMDREFYQYGFHYEYTKGMAAFEQQRLGTGQLVFGVVDTGQISGPYKAALTALNGPADRRGMAWVQRAQQDRARREMAAAANARRQQNLFRDAESYGSADTASTLR